MLSKAVHKFILISVIALVPMACSFAPERAIPSGLALSGITTEVKITRGATFNLSKNLSVGLAKKKAIKPESDIISDQLYRRLSENFYEVKWLQNTASPGRNTDLIMQTELFLEEQVSKPKPINHSSTKDEQALKNHKEESKKQLLQQKHFEKPKIVVLKIVLIDAQDQKIIDTFKIRSRMGALTARRGYAFFIDEMINAFLADIGVV